MADPRLTSRTWKRVVSYVLARDGYRCMWCGAPLRRPGRPGSVGQVGTADHLIARSHGGSDAPGNLIAACRPCNSSRGARPGPPPRLSEAGRQPRPAPPTISPRTPGGRVDFTPVQDHLARF